MSEESLITDETRAMIGFETPAITGYPVTEHEIRRYACAVDDLNPLWLDPEFASKSPHGGIIAPPYFHRIPFAADRSLSELSEDGTPRGDALQIRPPFRRATRGLAGTSVAEFLQPIRPGDTLTRRSRLVDVYERTGKSGLMAFVVTETTYTNQRGETVVLETRTDIAR